MRPSRRQPDELRAVSLDRGVVKYAEGSCFVKFGDTHVLVTATLEDRLPPWLKGQGRGWVTAEYGMLPRATHERTRRGLARSFQLPRPFASLSVAENLRVPLLYTVNARSGPHLSAADIEARTAELLSLVGLANRGSQQPRDLTQVDMRKLELARALAAEPKLLIADESMAGLSNNEVADIVALLIRLNERGITIIMIEHIMRAVMSFSQRLVVLVSGKKIADGAPDIVIRDHEVERAYIGQ